MSASLDAAEGDETVLSVSFTVPDKHFLYAHALEIRALGKTALEPRKIPDAKEKYDPTFEKVLGVYEGNPTFLYTLAGELSAPIKVEVHYQGCNESLCFLPQTRTFTLQPEKKSAGVTPEEKAAPDRQHEPGDWRDIADRLTVAGKASGYLKPDAFLEFLNGGQVVEGPASSSISRTFQDKGIVFTVLLIILGGLALNLTPCVLPMIPVNIAIIGAGAQAGSRKRGFALGTMYGVGIALVYGLLGLIVLLTGAKFGSLNASPWFNTAITALFILLSLSMFGVFNLDFSRLQGKLGSGGGGRGSFLTAFVMGGVAALLAGA